LPPPRIHLADTPEIGHDSGYVSVKVYHGSGLDSNLPETDSELYSAGLASVPDLASSSGSCRSG